MTRSGPVGAALIVAVALLAGCRAEPGANRAGTGVSPGPSATIATPQPVAGRPVGVPADATAAIVTAHVDGDTVWLRGTGHGGLVPDQGRTKVRILEINTPEVYGTVECFGREASDYAARRLPLTSTVWVAADREPRDRYGRLLLYLWTADGTFYDEAAVREGYARALLVAPNDRYIAPIRAAEMAARQAGRGLWGRCH